jgi:polyhydroxyalkanoate synthase
MLKTLSKVGEYWTADPARLVEAQTKLFGSYMAVCQAAMAQATGADSGPAIQPKPGDKRFNDPDWDGNPLFSSLKQFYLATARWAEDLVKEAEGLDPRTRNKARFYLEQINNALAPTNFPLTNPEVLKETAASNAENLAKGMRMLAEDIEAGKGSLRLRQTGRDGFQDRRERRHHTGQGDPPERHLPDNPIRADDADGAEAPAPYRSSLDQQVLHP